MSHSPKSPPPLPAPIVAAPIAVALGRRAETKRWSRERVSSFLGSLFIHATVLVALSLILNWVREKPTVPEGTLEWAMPPERDLGEFFDPSPRVITTPDVTEILRSRHEPDPIDAQVNDITLPPAQPEFVPLADSSPVPTSTAPPAAARDPFHIEPNPTLLLPPQTMPGPGPVPAGSSDGPILGDIENRKRWRTDNAISHGGSQSSEAAVERGLHWLKAHQRKDGAWHFNHNEGPCNGLCRDPGSASATTASTGLALLAFFGAGYTQRDDGEYQETIQKGLYYLTNRLLQTPHGGDLQEGTMYAQGIAAIALCEAYALTKEEVLKSYAQSAIKFIVYAQDQHGGGWRYFPGQPGDTTVFGWQLMALKSAQMAGLDVPSPSFSLAQKYLDSVQTDEGAGYGYQSPLKGTETTTAVGLLSRMYLGWDRERPALAKGIAFLEKTGPLPDNLYFNYYAAQVLHHADSHGWPRFNGKLRELLVATQATAGHESGSWYFSGGHAVTGGRHYNTCLAILTLEVYYRYLPLFGEKSVKSKF